MTETGRTSTTSRGLFSISEELVDAYWAVVAPMMETDELDPKREKPTHSWLRDHGFRPLLYALRESPRQDLRRVLA